MKVEGQDGKIGRQRVVIEVVKTSSSHDLLVLRLGRVLVLVNLLLGRQPLGAELELFGHRDKVIDQCQYLWLVSQKVRDRMRS